MEVRGERECRDCGTRWSYYDTGSVACPDCGSPVSVGVDDRTRHTDAPADLDLSPHRRAVDGEGVAAAADGVVRDCRAYLRRRGFVHAGDLRDLDDRYLAVAELVQAVDRYRRRSRDRAATVDERATIYLLELLRGADVGERPAAADVPDSMAPARGLAYADCVLDYRLEALDWLDDRPAGRRTLGRIAERAKRVRALEGDVPVSESEALVRATRDTAAYLRNGDEAALASARDRLDDL